MNSQLVASDASTVLIARQNVNFTQGTLSGHPYGKDVVSHHKFAFYRIDSTLR